MLYVPIRQVLKAKGMTKQIGIVVVLIIYTSYIVTINNRLKDVLTCPQGRESRGLVALAVLVKVLRHHVHPLAELGD